MKADKNYLVKCKCGCGEKFMRLDSKYRVREYIWGHANKIREYPEGFFDYLKGNSWGFPKGNKPWNLGFGDYMEGENNPFYGKRHTEETLTKISKENAPNWRGGISRINDVIRKSRDYVDWKVAIFLRDGRKCILCGSNKEIEADHIKPFSKYPELRFDLNNGRTLCHDCHIETPTYGNRKAVTIGL